MGVRLSQNPGLGGLDELTSSEELLVQNLAGLSYAQGDILYYDGSNLNRLAAGTSGQFLKTQGAGANPVWTTVSGSGDVVGPASATDNAIARFNTTTGKLIQDSVVTIADTTGVISGTEGVTFNGTTSGTTSVVATAVAGTTTITLPAATDTLVGKATTDTLTNKTIDATVNTLSNISNAEIKASAAIAVNKLAALTASEITGTDASGFLTSLPVATYPSLTELAYLKGVTSDIQTQIDTKAPTTAPTFTTSMTGSYLTASEILVTDGSKNIVSAPVATYPSLTELAYVKGVTSAIQTQIDAKGTGTMSNVVEDTTPQLGGDLDAQANHIGFTQQSITYNVTTTTVDWGAGNKATVTLTGNVGTMAFTNPPKPSNLVLKIVQDATGSRTVTAWDVDIKWAGGTAPTLTTTANGIDIVSFYFDGTNYYGVASLAFA